MSSEASPSVYTCQYFHSAVQFHTNFVVPCAPAVVGAGIGGSATAHFLRQHFGPEVQVDVFEKGEVGGRLATVTVNHNDYESGGSIIHSLNLHMQEFVKQLGGFDHTTHDI